MAGSWDCYFYFRGWHREKRIHAYHLEKILMTYWSWTSFIFPRSHSLLGFLLLPWGIAKNCCRVHKRIPSGDSLPSSSTFATFPVWVNSRERILLHWYVTVGPAGQNSLTRVSDLCVEKPPVAAFLSRGQWAGTSCSQNGGFMGV